MPVDCEEVNFRQEISKALIAGESTPAYIKQKILQTLKLHAECYIVNNNVVLCSKNCKYIRFLSITETAGPIHVTVISFQHSKFEPLARQ